MMKRIYLLRALILLSSSSLLFLNCGGGGGERSLVKKKELSSHVGQCAGQVVITFPDKDDPTRKEYDVSYRVFCSPDKNFTKETARLISRGEPSGTSFYHLLPGTYYCAVASTEEIDNVEKPEGPLSDPIEVTVPDGLPPCLDQCVPTTCQHEGRECGEIADGCGGPRLSCGSCPEEKGCNPEGKCVPIIFQVRPRPSTCQELGKNCGTLLNGVGGTINCGNCTAPETCGGGGTANVCGAPPCIPNTCAALGKNCGDISDGCSGTLHCGDCVAPETCGGGGTANVCGAPPCTPNTCAALGKNCGDISDGCGGMSNCGTCTAPQTCGGGGVGNVCGGGEATPGEAITHFWAKSYGGTDYDYASSVQVTADSQIIVAGGTSSFADEPSAPQAIWVLKLNPTGEVVWQKRYQGGGGLGAYAAAILPTADNRYIVVGELSGDAFIMKLNPDGTVAQKKKFGGVHQDALRGVARASDGNLIAVGSTNSFGDTAGDCLILKINPTTLTNIWQKKIGMAGKVEACHDIHLTPDGGFIVSGVTNSGGPSRKYDLWVVKLNASGAIEWQKAYGGPAEESGWSFTSMTPTNDGGYLLTGETRSFSAIASSWILKLRGDGAIVWQKKYEDGQFNRLSSIIQTGDGDYLGVGVKNIPGGETRLWGLRLTSDGSIKWQKEYGAAAGNARSVVKIQDGVQDSYISAGQMTADTWVLKITDTGDLRPIAADTAVAPVDTSGTLINTEAVISPITSLPPSEEWVLEMSDTNATVTQQAP